MSESHQWLEAGLQALPPEEADRVRLFRTLSMGAAQLRARMDRAMAGSGITTQQAAMLQFVEAQADPPTIGGVAAGLSMTHQNVKQIAAVLARKGFLTIEVDPLDRRVRRLQTTPGHRRFWARRNPNDFAQVRAWTAALTDAEVAQAVRLLRKLIGGLAESGPA